MPQPESLNEGLVFMSPRRRPNQTWHRLWGDAAAAAAAPAPSQLLFVARCVLGTKSRANTPRLRGVASNRPLHSDFP